MTILTESILLESASARESQLKQMSQTQAQELLEKIKSLYFALWQGTGIATTQQIAEFYEVPEANIRKAIERHREELELDGLKNIKGKELNAIRHKVCDSLSLSSNTYRLTIHTPRSTLRLGMILEDSKVAKAVRTSLLDIVEKVVPSLAQEIDRLKLELELAKTQERLLLTTQAIATMHGAPMVALILGKPDAVVTKVEKVETVVAVDSKGRALASTDGVGITYLAQRYGFGKNTRACRKWLESIGIRENQWITEPALVKAKKLSRELLAFLDRAFSAKSGTRQVLLGE